MSEGHAKEDTRLRNLRSAVRDFQSAADDLVYRLHGRKHEGRAKREAALGYPGKDKLRNADYRHLYERGGLAHRAVNFGPKMVWARGFEVVEDVYEAPYTDEEGEFHPSRIIEPKDRDKTAFEEDVNGLVRSLSLHAEFFRADVLASIARYSVLRLDFDDLNEGVSPKDPVQPGAQLVQVRPVHQDNAKITTSVTDFSDPRIGLPEFYDISSTDPVTGTATKAERVHWQRVVHFTRLTLDDPVRGLPVLKPVYDLFFDLLKVGGGGSEALWRSAYRVLHANAQDPKAPKPTPEQEKKLEQQLEEAVEYMRSYLITIGMDLDSHGADAVDFSNQAEAIIKQIAGTLGISWRELVGTEVGLRSSETERVTSEKRVDEDIFIYADPAVRRLVDRLVYLETVEPPESFTPTYPFDPLNRPEYAIDWRREMEHTPEERVEMVERITKANKANAESGDGPVLSGDEIRSKYLEMEPRDFEFGLPLRGGNDEEEDEDELDTRQAGLTTTPQGENTNEEPSV